MGDAVSHVDSGFIHFPLGDAEEGDKKPEKEAEEGYKKPEKQEQARRDQKEGEGKRAGKKENTYYRFKKFLSI